MKTIARPRRSLAIRSSGPYALSICRISIRLRCFTHCFALTSHDLYINHIILTKTVNIQKLGHFQKVLWGKLTNSSKYFQPDFCSFDDFFEGSWCQPTKVQGCLQKLHTCFTRNICVFTRFTRPQEVSNATEPDKYPQTQPRKV